MHEQNIIDSILEKLDTNNCNVKCISLVCDREGLTNRLQKDVENGIRTKEVIGRSIERIPLYQKLDTIKIDTTGKDVDMVVSEIKKI